MKIPSIILFTYMVVFGCKNNNSSDNVNGENNEQKASENSSKTDKAKNPVAICYMRVLQRDSFTAKLEREGDRISGNLHFDNFEKDASSGPVTGVINDNIIRLIYTFQSEGMTSVMEVYFKTRGDDLIRGVGEMIAKNDTLYFKNPEDVQYPANEKWRKQACEPSDRPGLTSDRPGLTGDRNPLEWPPSDRDGPDCVFGTQIAIISHK